MAVTIDTPITRPYGYEHPTPGTVTELVSNEAFLSGVLGGPRRFHYTSRSKLHVVNMPVRGYDGETRNGAALELATVSLAIQAVHQAFAAHVPLSLRPDTLWYLIVHEVAGYVRQHPGQSAGLFTGTPGREQQITVDDDSLRYDAPSDWMRSVNLVRGPLREKITDRTMELFLPRFTTSTAEDETALLVALMDVVSPYYGFKWRTDCGIPQVRLEGEAPDWQALCTRADLLAREFSGLSGYFAGLLPVLQEIAATASGAAPDQEFWRSVYKVGGGSGGPYVNGWITAFFAHVQTRNGPRLREHFDWAAMAKEPFGGFTTDQFPSHVSQVPFVWQYHGTLHNMAFAAGVTGVDHDGTFLSPRLGFAVTET
jgi:hypothetical protein